MNIYFTTIGCLAALTLLAGCYEPCCKKTAEEKIVLQETDNTEDASQATDTNEGKEVIE